MVVVSDATCQEHEIQINCSEVRIVKNVKLQNHISMFFMHVRVKVNVHRPFSPNYKVQVERKMQFNLDISTFYATLKISLSA